MWVIYHNETRQVVGMSADSELELEKDYALEEVVRGLVHAEAVDRYDALQVRDRTHAKAVFGTPLEWLVLREAPHGGLHLAIEAPKRSSLRLRCDAPDVHPVDGMPEIRADGVSFTPCSRGKKPTVRIFWSSVTVNYLSPWMTGRILGFLG